MAKNENDELADILDDDFSDIEKGFNAEEALPLVVHPTGAGITEINGEIISPLKSTPHGRGDYRYQEEIISARKSYTPRARGLPGFNAEDALPLVMTAQEVANLLRISYRVIIKIAKEHTIPAFMVAGQWRFSRPTILKWIDDISNEDYDPIMRSI